MGDRNSLRKNRIPKERKYAKVDMCTYKWNSWRGYENIRIHQKM